jgi:phenylacetate-CoA ligase
VAAASPYRSALAGIEWPALPAGDAAMRAAMQFHLDHTQWLPPARLAELQFRQLGALIGHAGRSVAYYRERWHGQYDPTASLTAAQFSALPLLTRRDLQEHFEELKSNASPPAHGAIGEARTSGSTGAPVRVLKTDLCAQLWNAFTLRDHLWHRRDFGGRLAAIRHGVSNGDFDGWGQATDGLVTTGPSAVRGVEADVETLFGWLLQQQPDYLITHPSLAAELARVALAGGGRLARLREVRTYGELLSPETRELCRDAWGVGVTDTYSTNEVGYIALQCPQHEHLHVQSEGVFLEVLDDGGRACNPGEVGRVVVTALHNFAMPLVRYDVGDYAEVGAPCDCGRGLPVLRRIIGRVRNTLVTASGRRYWPVLGARALVEAAPIRQYQLVQKAFDRVEARLVVASALTPAQEATVRSHILSRLPSELHLDLVYCENIARSAGGKFEDFISEVNERSVMPL